MKFLKSLLLMAVVLMLLSCSQSTKTDNKYVISAEIKGAPDGTDVFICYLGNPLPIVSTKIKDGRFEVSVSIDEESLQFSMILQSEGKNRETTVIMGKNDIHIEADYDSLFKRKVTGSVYENDLSDFNTYYYKNASKEYNLLDSFIQNNDKISRSEALQLLQRIDSIDNYDNELRKNYILKHPESYASLDELFSIADILPKKEFNSLFQNLDTIYNNTTTWKNLNDYYKEPKRLEAGEKYFDFTATDQYGKSRKLSEIKGRYILLEFTPLGCRGCEMAKKELALLHEKYNKNLAVISFYLDEDRNDWLNDVKKSNIKYLCLSDGKGKKSEIRKQYIYGSVPSFFLINPLGIIVKKWGGYGYPPIEVKIGKYIL